MLRNLVGIVALLFVGCTGCMDSEDVNPVGGSGGSGGTGGVGGGGGSEVADAGTDAQKPECYTLPNGAFCGANGSCNAGTCVEVFDCSGQPDGTLCGGLAIDGYRCQCQDGAPHWGDYQCYAQEDGTKCKSDWGAAGTCLGGSCCYGCVSMGMCTLTGAGGGNPQQGEPCK